MPTRPLKEKLTFWEMMSNNLKNRLTEVPQLEPDQTELERLVAAGQALEDKQSIQTAALRETNRQRSVLERQGDQLLERMANGLKHHLGPESKLLIEFGLKPKAPRRRRRLTAEERKALELERLEKRMAELKGTPAAAATS